MKKLKITLEGKTYEVDVEIVGSTDNAAPVAAPPLQSAAPVVVAPAASVATPAPAPAVPLIAGAQSITSPMPGIVFKISVAVGDQVADGQQVLVVDAMKMESPVYTQGAGTVVAILVKEGDSVSEGQILVQLS
jgi:glutaconyl-CoA/methylmalonyl-CoA decarboxylase subunit gamma